MARRNKVEGDPLVACSLRLHQSLVERIEKEAREIKLGRSDYLRQIIQKYDTGPIELTNRPTPVKRRPPPVSIPRPIDPALVSAVVSCGNSLNLLATGVCAANSDIGVLMQVNKTHRGYIHLCLHVDVCVCM